MLVAVRLLHDSVERVDAASSLAYARRLTSAELGECVGLVAASPVSCSTTGLAFVVPSADTAGTELVTYQWDAARRVLWRKAPSSHVAEDVAGFSLSYFDAQGHALPIASGGV